jgi:Protein of unknown function (DUF3467)
MTSAPKPPGPSITVELGERESEGIYSNLALISHTPAEFILDFARLLPGARKARVHARIVMTPQHVKMLRAALDQNLSRFEGEFGTIQTPAGGDVTPRNIGFTTTPTPLPADTGAKPGEPDGTGPAPGAVTTRP